MFISFLLGSLVALLFCYVFRSGPAPPAAAPQLLAVFAPPERAPAPLVAPLQSPQQAPPSATDASLAAPPAAPPPPLQPPPPPPPPAACILLPPSDSAEVHWPNRWPEQNYNFGAERNAPPAPRLVGSAVADVWRLEACGRPVAGAPVRGDDFFLDLGQGRSSYCGATTAAAAPGAAAAALPCDGLFRLSRLEGCPGSAAAPSGAEELPLAGAVSPETRADAWALGPDEVVFTLEGPELLVLQGRHVGRCVYEFPFSVTVPGVYRAFVLAARADWDAISDAPSFPALTQDRPVGNALLVALGDPTAGAAAHALVVARGDASHHEPCREPSPPGRWALRAHPGGGLFQRAAALPVYDQPWFYPPRVAWHVDHLRELVHLPYRCRWPRDAMAPAAARACLAGKNLNMRGDSQTRVLFNEFLAGALNVSRAVAKGSESPFCLSVTPEEGGVAPFFGCLVGDMHLEGQEVLLHSDGRHRDAVGAPYAVVVNAGQHFVAGQQKREGLSLAGYEAHLRAYAARLLREAAEMRGGDGPAAFRGVVWVETLPHPLRNDGYVWGHKDGRTLHKLALLNRIAERELRGVAGAQLQEGTPAARPLLRFLRAWEVLLPMLDVFPDQSHAEGTPALGPVAQGLFNLLCAGGAGGPQDRGFVSGALVGAEEYGAGFFAAPAPPKP